MADQTIKLTVRSPEAILFTGEAKALSSYNIRGLFDVLPLHENFISIIQKEVVVHLDKEDKSFPVEYGILKVTSNEIVVLLGVQTVDTTNPLLPH